jgi:subtilisin family serine protease
VTNSYIVVLRDGVEASPQTLLSKYKGTLKHTYRAALNGFSVHDISETQARRLAADPRGSHVQRNLRTKIQQNQFGSRLGVWTASTSALCRYAYPDQAGAGVRAYVINSGIRTTHVDFQGRASHGYDVVDNDRSRTTATGTAPTSRARSPASTGSPTTECARPRST